MSYTGLYYMSHKGSYVSQKIVCHKRNIMSHKGPYVTQGILCRTRDRMSHKGNYVAPGVVGRQVDLSLLVDVIIRFFKQSYPLNYEILSVEGFHVSFEGLSCFGEAS